MIKIFVLLASLACTTQAAQRNVKALEIAQGYPGRGFGDVPLFAFGAKHMKAEQDKLIDIQLVNMDEKMEGMTRSACSAWSTDKFEARTNDENFGEKMKFSSWLADLQEAYKNDLGNTRNLADGNNTTDDGLVNSTDP